MARRRPPDDGSLSLFDPPRETEAHARSAAGIEPAAAATDPTPAATEPAPADIEPAPADIEPAPAAAPAPFTSDAGVQRILEGLNQEQRDAVTHGEGPLLIVAGAGTGKTHAITSRIAWLIATKRARPEQILALTFTEKAAAEMEARVDALVPYGFTGSTICTFHAFGDRMLREHAVELGLTTQLRVESDAEILVFLREHLFELELDRYLPLGKPDEHLRSLLGLFDRARDEDVSPQAYRAFAERLGAAADTDDRRDRAAMELEKARAYAAYQKLILTHGRIDFGSQIGLALRLLRERPYLRREYAERFRFILVDEFQDTNYVQFELVKLLAGERRNLTVVGDDDQSIYRFRGAKVENLLRFVDEFPGAREILLTRNYRSGQRILDASHRLIQFNNPARLEAVRGYDKRLVAARGAGGTIELKSFRTMSDEADAVAAEIAAALEYRERPPGHFAILARTHGHLDPFASALKARGIRFQRSSTRGLYARPEVQLVLNLLRSIADPDDGGAVYHALGDPMFGVDPLDLGWISARARARRASLVGFAATMARDPSAGIKPESREAISRFVELHHRLAASAVHRATTEVMYEFAESSGLLSRLAAADSPEAIEQAQNLNKLFRIAARIGPLLKRDRVDQFIGHLDLLIEAGDDPSAADVEIDEDAVHLLTAHNAKGLEFPVVYMVQLVQQRFPLGYRAESLGLPPELHRGTVDEKADHDREERRLFYVGMTRAMDRLVFTSALDYGGGYRPQSRKLSSFVMEALNLPAPPKSLVSPSGVEGIARFAPGAEPQAAELAPMPPEVPLKLSKDQIDDFLTCPLKYRYAHVVKIPLGRDPRAMFGSAVHHAIKIYHQHRRRGLPITLDDVLGAFEGAWSSEGFYTREHEELRLEEGRVMLRRFFEREERSGLVPLAVEAEFAFTQGHDHVTGRFDRIDERQGEIVIVDYKTAEVEAADRAEQRAAKSLKEDQLGLYALAYLETRKAMPQRVELQFVETGVVGSAAVEPIHIELARERVAAAGRGIRAAQFPPKPEKQRCLYCPYSRFCIHSAARGAGG